MPIPSQYNLPSPMNEDEFEDMVEDYFKIKYTNTQRYGRKGQKQYGLDITYTDKSSQKLIGIQCKKYASLSTSDVDSIINAVGNFYIRVNDNCTLEISTLIIATTALRDTKIQNYILQKRQELNRDIEIIFWEDIRPVIAENIQLLQKYYPTIYNYQQSNIVSIDDLVSKFNHFMIEHKILDFIKVDPFLGMPSYLPFEIDIFYETIKSNLDSSIVLQNDKVFIAINNFINLLNNYNGYLSLLMYPVNSNYYSFQKTNRSLNWDEIREEIKTTKLKLDKLYSIINNDCRLFY